MLLSVFILSSGVVPPYFNLFLYKGITIVILVTNFISYVYLCRYADAIITTNIVFIISPCQWRRSSILYWEWAPTNIINTSTSFSDVVFCMSAIGIWAAANRSFFCRFLPTITNSLVLAQNLQLTCPPYQHHDYDLW